MLLQLPDLSAPIDFTQIFGREAPVEIEIGVGKGRFLRERAQAFPDHNFLGLEKSRKWLRVAVEKIERAGLPHVHLINSYVEGFLERYVSDRSIHQFHILFPDPWPKRRHLKRRLLNPLFLHQILRTLVPGGEMNIATDYSDYFQMIANDFDMFSTKGFRFEKVPPGPFVSNFQMKYFKEGRSLYFARATKDQAATHAKG